MARTKQIARKSTGGKVSAKESRISGPFCPSPQGANPPPTLWEESHVGAPFVGGPRGPLVPLPPLSIGRVVPLICAVDWKGRGEGQNERRSRHGGLTPIAGPPQAARHQGRPQNGAGQRRRQEGPPPVSSGHQGAPRDSQVSEEHRDAHPQAAVSAPRPRDCPGTARRANLALSLLRFIGACPPLICALPALPLPGRDACFVARSS
jgi:hypothetical protein